MAPKPLIQIRNISSKKKRSHELVLKGKALEFSYEDLSNIRDALDDYLEDTPLPEPGEKVTLGG